MKNNRIKSIRCNSQDIRSSALYPSLRLLLIQKQLLISVCLINNLDMQKTQKLD